MKQIFTLILSAVLILQCMPVAAVSEETENDRIIYVSATKGNDSGDGSADSPFLSVKRAQEEARKLTEIVDGNVIVELSGGTYFQNETLSFDERDSGKHGNRVIYRSADGERAVISGGRPVTNWIPGTDGIWQAKVDGLEYIREFYVNGEKKRLARTENKVIGQGYYVENNVQKGVLLDKSLLDGIEHPEDMIFRWSAAWMCYALRCEKIVAVSETQSAAVIQPDFQTLSSREINPIKANAGVIIENALKFLDTPGEFYFDSHAGMLYYMPRNDENMKTAETVVPVLEKLMEIRGSNGNARIKSLDFENLTFSHGAWNLPAQVGFNAVQAQWIYTEGFETEFTPSNITVSYADDIGFYGNTFTGLGCVGLGLDELATNVSIVGNAFYDIKDSAISVGLPSHNYISNAEYADAARGRTATASSIYSVQTRPSQAVNAISREFGWKPLESDKQPWIQVDLGKETDIAEVSLLFESGGMTNGYVFLSNDADFASDTVRFTAVPNPVNEEYERLFAGDTAQGKRYTYDMSNIKKYRYVRVYTEKNSKLCEFSVFDREQKGSASEGVCSNNLISNNYITRVADYFWSSPGIVAYYVDNLKVLNNHIENLPYTGISVGWGWVYNTDSTTCHNNVISKNFLKNVMTECYDGGGIYTLGQQPGTKISENYIRGCSFPYGAIYLDGGSTGITVTENVTEDTSPYFMNSPAEGENRVFRNYVTNPKTIIQNEETNVSDARLFAVGMPCAEANYIMNASGLEMEYRHLIGQVPEAEVDYDAFGKEGLVNLTHSNAPAAIKWFILDDDVKMGQVALDLAQTGSGLWQFPQSAIDSFGEALARAQEVLSKQDDELTAEEWINESCALKNAYNMFFESRNKISYEELLAKADAELEKALNNPGLYPTLVTETFAGFLNDNPSYVKNDDSYLHLEQAYMSFVTQKNPHALVNKVKSVSGTVATGNIGALFDGDYSTAVGHYGSELSLVADLGEETLIECVEIVSRINPANNENGGVRIQLSNDPDFAEDVYELATTVENTSGTVIYTDNYGIDCTENSYSYRGTEKYRYVRLYRESGYTYLPELRVMSRITEQSAQANVASGKRVFSPSNRDVSALVDGNDLNLVELFQGRYIVDLGAYYPIEAVIAYGRADGYSSGDNFSIILSKHPNIPDNDSITVKNFTTGSDALQAGDNILDVPDKVALCRYVAIDVPSYNCMTEIEVIPVRSFAGNENGNLAYNKPIFLSNCVDGAMATNLNSAKQECDYAEFWHGGYTNPGFGYAQIDLGNMYDISKVVVSFRSWIDNEDERKNWQVQLSEDFTFTNPLTYSLAAAPVLGEDWVIDISETANCRYVRLVKSDKGYGLVQEIAVYAKNNTEKAKPVGLCLNKTSSSGRGNVTIEGVKIKPGYEINDSRLITAVYDKGKLVDVNITDFESTDEGSVKYKGDDNYLFGKEEQIVKFDSALPLELDADGKALNSVKAFIWSGFDTIKPLSDVLEITEGMLTETDKE